MKERHRADRSRWAAALLASAVFSAAGARAVTPRPERAGDLDPSFGSEGWVAVTFDLAPWLGAYGDRVAVAPDGKILLCGTAWRDEGYYTSEDFAFARLTIDGAIDPTFDVDGRFTSGFDLGGYDDDELYGCAVAPGGEVVAVGRAWHSYAYWSAVALRARPGASTSWELDPTFAGDGRLIWDLRGGYDLFSGAVNLAILKGGSILGGGNRYGVLDDRTQPWVSRLLPSSSSDEAAMDPSFADSGLFVFPDNSFRRGVDAIDVAREGKTVATSGATLDSGTSGVFVFRLLEQGVLDPSFGGVGWRFLELPGLYGQETSGVLADRRGATHVIGYAILVGETYTGIFAVKLDPEGQLDPGFGDAGIAFVPPSELGEWGSWATGAVLQGDGRIVLGAYYFLQSGERQFLAVRLLPDGSLDPAFGLDGIARVPNGGPQIGVPLNGAAGIAMQSDGRLVLVGTCIREGPGGSAYPMCACRLQNDYIFADGFEDGTPSAWSGSQP